MTRHTADDYRNCAIAGMTQMEAAARLSVSETTVSRMGTIHGIKFKPAKIGRKSKREKGGSRDDGRSTRIQIVKLLHKPRTEGEMAEALSLVRSTISWHLNKLESMGIVRRAEKVHQIQIWELATSDKKSEVAFTSRRVVK